MSEAVCFRCQGTGFCSAGERRASGLDYSYVKRCDCESGRVDGMSFAGVPDHLRSLHEQGLTPAQADAMARSRKAVADGGSVVLAGRAGVGKTGIAVCLLRAANAEGRRVAWCHVPSWLREIRDSYRAEGGASEVAMLERVVSPEFLVVDDLGAEPTSDWSNSMLYGLIDGRDSRSRPTAYTTNLTRQQIETTYGERISSRVSRCLLVAVGGPDRRSRR